MSLEDLEKELYGQRPAQTNKTTQSGVVTAKEKSTDNSSRFDPWNTERKQQSEKNTKSITIKDQTQKSGVMGRGILLGGIIVLLVLVGFAGYYLYQYFTTKDIAITITTPNQVSVGESFTATLSFENISTKKLIAPKVYLALPEGVVFADTPDKRTREADIHDVDPQETIQMEYALLVIGKSQQTYELEGGVSYGYEAASLSSRFDKGATASIVAVDTVFGLDITAPEKTLNGEEFDISARYQNLSNRDLASSTIVFTFPKGFVVTGSSVPLDKNNGVNIDLVPARGEGVVTISGYIIGDEYSYFTTQVDARAQIGSIVVPLVTKTVSSSILPSPLSVRVVRDRATNPDVVYAGTRISYKVQAENTSDTPLVDAVARVYLKDSLFDTASIEGSGHFDESTKAYTWTAAQIPALKEIGSHASFSIPFSIMLKQANANDVLEQKTITVRAQITSPTVPPLMSAKETVGIGQAESRLGGALGITQEAYFQEPSSDIVNQGSLPPRVGAPIQYTIHWKLRGMGDFNNAIIRATLAPGVSWTGKLKVSGVDASPTYNERTQEIIWSVPTIAATTLASTTPEAIFQIMFTPSSQDSGNTFNLISDAQITSVEVASQKQIQSSARGLSSRQLQDARPPEGYYRVLPK